MRALNVVHYMTYTKEDLHHQMYSETKCGVKAPTYNRTNNNPNGHSAQQRLCPSGYSVDGNRNNDGHLAWLSGRGYSVDGNRNNDGQLAWLSGRVDADGNRSGSGSEPAWQAQTACFGSAPCVVYQEDRRYADEHRRYEDERW